MPAFRYKALLIHICPFSIYSITHRLFVSGSWLILYSCSSGWWWIHSSQMNIFSFLLFLLLVQIDVYVLHWNCVIFFFVLYRFHHFSHFQIYHYFVTIFYNKYIEKYIYKITDLIFNNFFLFKLYLIYRIKYICLSLFLHLKSSIVCRFCVSSKS